MLKLAMTESLSRSVQSPFSLREQSLPAPINDWLSGFRLNPALGFGGRIAPCFDLAGLYAFIGVATTSLLSVGKCFPHFGATCLFWHSKCISFVESRWL